MAGHTLATGQRAAVPMTGVSMGETVTGGAAEVSREAALHAFRTMLTARRVDDREILLKQQNLAFFQINGVGHEAVLAAAAQVLDGQRDWFFTYYRDRALMLGLGMTPYEMFLGSIGAEASPDSRGRQMPSHWGMRRLHVAPSSSPTGTQCLQAVGFAEAGRIGNAATLHPDTAPQPGEVVLVSLGDGTTSQGEFWESLNTACSLRLPVLYLIEDNGWAISVPVQVQTPGGSISKLVSHFPNLAVYEVDGCDFRASLAVLGEAVARVRAGEGPALVHAHVVRPYSHSLSDDERLYKPEALRQAEAARDPLVLMRAYLRDELGVSEAELAALEAEVQERVAADAERALAMPQPEPGEWALHIYSPRVDPTAAAWESQPCGDDPSPKTMVDLLNACLKDEMARDERIVVFGEDVADCSLEGALEEVKGKGGVFKVTHGLQRLYGSRRVFNSPLAEANIVGRAVGMALRGLKPVVEIQFFDYIWPAYQQIRNELATTRWRSGGAWSAPVVIRVPTGGYLKGGGPYHSQTGAVLFTSIPGLRVVMPSTAVDANGLLRTAIRCDDPVIFLEHKHLYRQTHNKGPYPGPEYTIPFGRAARVSEGDDLTVISYGATVVRAAAAARRLFEVTGKTVELLDLRTLHPYDWGAVAASVRRTGRALVVYEEPYSFGYGAELAARIGEELFPYLDAPVRRVAAKDTFVAYAPALENVILPQSEDIFEAMYELVRY